MNVEIMSFGRKYGVPEADIILDMRCLENPFWVPELKNLSGLDKPVQDYILSFPVCKEYVENLLKLLGLQASMSEKSGREALHIAIGCTGGRHRSVAVSKLLADYLQQRGHTVTLLHRDIEKG